MPHAGLDAAYQLVQGGHEVTVLEARSRPGFMQGALESGERAAREIHEAKS
jgi:monoamine oxidase